VGNVNQFSKRIIPGDFSMPLFFFGLNVLETKIDYFKATQIANNTLHRNVLNILF
jgi:hypothetical protein